MAAWMGILNKWRGIISFSFSHIMWPRISARAVHGMLRLYEAGKPLYQVSTDIEFTSE
jgi:hypothetical protein